MNILSSLTTVWHWSKIWGLGINLIKYKYFTIRREVQLRLSFFPENQIIQGPRVPTDDIFSPSAQCTEDANKARRLVFMLRHSFQGLSKSAFIPLCGALVRPHLEYVMPACSPNLVADINLLDGIQNLSSRLVTGMRHLPCEERLQRMGLHSLQRRRLRADLSATFKGLLDIDPNFFSFLPLDSA